MIILHTLGALVALALAAIEIARRVRRARAAARHRLSDAGMARLRAALLRIGAAGDRVRGA
jgi:hypothetical protein